MFILRPNLLSCSDFTSKFFNALNNSFLDASRIIAYRLNFGFPLDTFHAGLPCLGYIKKKSYIKYQ